MNRIARFMMDPRDVRDDEDWFDVVADENGVFGCVGLMACHDVCPKDLPLLEVYAYLRRRALAQGWPSRAADHGSVLVPESEIAR